MALTEQKPSIGRIVHYVLTEGESRGEIRPAIIVRVLDAEKYFVNLRLFLDLGNDSASQPDFIGEAILGDRDNPGTWFWPPMV